MNFAAINPLPPQTSEGEVIQDEVGQLLRRAHQRASSILSGAFGPGGFTPPQFAVLNKLLEVGSMSQNSLGRAVAMDAATTQGVVRRMIERGLVARASDASDRRRVCLSLTAKGRQAVGDALERATAAEHAILAPLNPRERTTLVRLLRRIA
ncbi:MAG: MarR family transcriptional regulator [Rhodospirillaceae bacterium]